MFAIRFDSSTMHALQSLSFHISLFAPLLHLPVPTFYYFVWKKCRIKLGVTEMHFVFYWNTNNIYLLLYLGFNLLECLQTDYAFRQYSTVRRIAFFSSHLFFFSRLNEKHWRIWAKAKINWIKAEKTWFWQFWSSFWKSHSAIRILQSNSCFLVGFCFASWKMVTFISFASTLSNVNIISLYAYVWRATHTQVYRTGMQIMEQ